MSAVVLPLPIANPLLHRLTLAQGLLAGVISVPGQSRTALQAARDELEVLELLLRIGVRPGAEDTTA